MSKKLALISAVAMTIALLTACGDIKTPDRQVSLKINWDDQAPPTGFSGYVSNLSAKGMLAADDNESTAPNVDGKLASDGAYTFAFLQVANGDYIFKFDLYYSSADGTPQNVASGEISVSFDEETSISATVNSADLVQTFDPSQSFLGALTSLNPLSTADSDSDGLDDKAEKELGTDPLNADTDGDGVPDGVEVSQKTTPVVADTDGDGVSDKEDAFPLDKAEWADTDTDGVGDNADNCPNAANANQLDSDKDGKGDACAEDDDGDGLKDADEAIHKTDPKNPDTDGDGVPDGAEVAKGTNPLSKDTENDGASDKDDVFPLDPSEWADRDGDAAGDNKDNCINIPNPDQKNTDLAYAAVGIKTPAGADVVSDAYGDACDTDIDNDGLHATYVNFAGSVTSPGTFNEPVKTIQGGIALAKSRFGVVDEVRVSAGTYASTASVTFADGVNVYGGYTSDFSGREVHSDGPLYKTVLADGTAPVTIRLQNFSGSFILDGFFITNTGSDDAAGTSGILPDTDDYGCNQATVYIVNSTVTLSNNIITGNAASQRACGVLLGVGASVTLNANMINGGGSNTSDASTGLGLVETTSATITNNIIIAGNGEHSTGIRMTNASPIVTNNTIDGTSNAALPRACYGVVFNGGSPKLANNLVFTNLASDQAVLVCSGADLTGAEIKNNILTTFPQTGINAVLVDCEGDFTLTSDFVSNPTFALTGAVVSGNVAFSGILSDLVDSAYNLAGAAGVDAGLDAGVEVYGNVTSDYNGEARTLGSYDIGAIEK